METKLTGGIDTKALPIRKAPPPPSESKNKATPTKSPQNVKKEPVTRPKKAISPVKKEQALPPKKTEAEPLGPPVPEPKEEQKEIYGDSDEDEDGLTGWNS